MIQLPRQPLPSQDDEPGYAPIVAAIGSTAAVELFLKFGGSTVYIPERPHAGSRLVQAIGAPAVTAMRRELGRGHISLPLANAWIARQLAARGVPRAEMCRLMRISRTSLKSYLSSKSGKTGAVMRRPKRGGARTEEAAHV